jgi:putative ATP-binding cassette transporter
LWTFLVIVAALLTLTVAQTFLQERLKIRLREWIARHLLVAWLKPMRIYQLSFAGLYGRNPDQRLQEDTRLLGDYTADLGCGLVYSLLQIAAFVGVLWACRRRSPSTWQVITSPFPATWSGAPLPMP